MNKIIAEFLRCTARNRLEYEPLDPAEPLPETCAFPLLHLLRSNTAGILRELTAEGRHD